MIGFPQTLQNKLPNEPSGAEQPPPATSRLYLSRLRGPPSMNTTTRHSRAGPHQCSPPPRARATSAHFAPKLPRNQPPAGPQTHPSHPLVTPSRPRDPPTAAQPKAPKTTYKCNGAPLKY